jgi:regulator of RNase E activity RraA
MARRLMIAATLFALPAAAQIGMFTNEQRAGMTSEWKGERFADGRPKVPDEVLDRLKETTAEEAWGVLGRRGYPNQFVGGFKTVNVKPDGRAPRMVGRAVTGVFLPKRADLDAWVTENAKKEKRVGRGGQNAWVIDTLVKRDVMVIDMFGKINNGTIIGDNLATSIMTKTGNGIVCDCAVRDVSGISEIEGFQVFVRDFHPSAIRDVTLSGINVPIRIGEATVMPGDVVLSDPEGVTFIPAHLAEEVANDSEMTRLRDEWGHKMLKEQKYTPGQIDSNWTPDMVEEFNKYAASKGSKMQMKPRAPRQ